MTQYQLKRAYDPEADNDGFRVYIDRLWPRGLSHETFHYDLWAKDIAPSTGLREWFHTDPDAHWAEFERRYAAELKANPAFATLKATLETHPKVTLLYSSHNTVENNAIVIRNLLNAKG